MRAVQASQSVHRSTTRVVTTSPPKRVGENFERKIKQWYATCECSWNSSRLFKSRPEAERARTRHMQEAAAKQESAQAEERNRPRSAVKLTLVPTGDLLQPPSRVQVDR